MHDVTLDLLENLNCPHCGRAIEQPLPEAFTKVICTACGETTKIPGKFGQFLLYDSQGESVTSVVYDAFDPKLGRNVTLKILNYVLCKNPELVEAFKNEALAAAALNSTFVLKVYEFGIHNRQPFMVMEHIEGKFLHEVLQERKLSEFDILEIIDGIVQGLQDMHDRGIMHGDVMPRNILIHTDGTPRISDFGLARFNGQNASESSERQWESWSSPYYMPPERIEGKAEDFRGDFYSLGTTLYNMLTGELPFFDMDESKVLKQKISEYPPDPRHSHPEISDGMAELAGRLLQRDPDDRPASYEDLRELLAEEKASMPRPERAIPEPEPLPDYQQNPKKKKEPRAWFIFLVLVGILGAMLISLPHKKKDLKEVEEPKATQIPVKVVPTPTLAPTPLPLPTPDPTPTPQPVPTPVPLPTQPEQVPGIELYIDPDQLSLPVGHPISELRDSLTQKVIFSQSLSSKRPQHENTNGTQSVLSFSGSRMDASLDLLALEEFTLLTMIRISPEKESAMWILGIDEKAGTPKQFSISTDPDLPNSVRFKTERGSALLTLPRHHRGKAVLLGFQRNPEGETAFLGNIRSQLSTTAPQFPPFEAERFPGLQLGGLEEEEKDFEGWIGEIQLYRRTLNDEEIHALSGRLNELYGDPP